MDWEASDRVCENRLKAALPHLVESMERHGHLQLNSVVRERLLTASASTLDRLLKPILSTAGSCRRRASEAHGTPVASTDLQRLETGPHRATWRSTWCPLRRSSLRFLHSHSLVATDICAGWTEAVPLLPRDQSLFLEGLEAIRRQLPLPIGGFAFDNDGVFINENLLSWPSQQGIEFTPFPGLPQQ